ncbi:MAG: PorT family protein [Bacteroidales bacterium]|nr:PorT family protein [Bacteroidales bacterium]
MQKLILILLITFFLLKSYAQDFTGGIIFGVCGSQIDGDSQSRYKKPGLIFGAYVQKPISDNGALKIEMYYIGKGAVFNIDNPDGTFFQEFNHSLHYIEIPVLYNLEIHPKINVAVGIASSYLFAHKFTLIKQEVDKNYYSIKDFDFQPMGQVDFYLTDRISSSLRISYSALSIRNDDVWYNNNLSVALRYTFE